MAKIRYQGANTEVYLQINNGASVVLRFFDSIVEGNEWPYFQKSNEAYLLENGWDIDFVEGGPDIPENVQNISLQPYSELNEKTEKFSGTVIYRNSFTNSEEPGIGYLLELGNVYESAEVLINGKSVGTLFGPEFSLFIDQSNVQEENNLEILVANRMANRIVSMEKENVLWKKFYNTNFPPRNRENLGKSGIFSASDWAYTPSGIDGPVVITKIINVE
jgi:hypothetical protein